MFKTHPKVQMSHQTTSLILYQNSVEKRIPKQFIFQQFLAVIISVERCHVHLQHYIYMQIMPVVLSVCRSPYKPWQKQVIMPPHHQMLPGEFQAFIFFLECLLQIRLKKKNLTHFNEHILNFSSQRTLCPAWLLTETLVEVAKGLS